MAEQLDLDALRDADAIRTAARYVDAADSQGHLQYTPMVEDVTLTAYLRAVADKTERRARTQAPAPSSEIAEIIVHFRDEEARIRKEADYYRERNFTAKETSHERDAAECGRWIAALEKMQTAPAPSRPSEVREAIEDYIDTKLAPIAEMAASGDIRSTANVVAMDLREILASFAVRALSEETT
jgi:hypothetical protein